MKNLKSFNEFVNEAKFIDYDNNESVNEALITSVIDRLAKEDSVDIDDFDGYVDHFLQSGASRLGGGSSAEVLQKGSSVIKIFAPINDPGMTRYLSFCLQNQKNPFTPRIKKILRSWAIEEDRWIYAVFMEKLMESSPSFTRDLNAVLLDDKFEVGFKFGESKKKDDKFFIQFKDVIMKYSKKGSEKDLSDIIAFLRGAMRKYKYGVDFGPQNWMMRGNQLVLIDPFWPDME
jgi:hypothetical protein